MYHTDTFAGSPSRSVLILSCFPFQAVHGVHHSVHVRRGVFAAMELLQQRKTGTYD